MKRSTQLIAKSRVINEVISNINTHIMARSERGKIC